MYVAMTEGIIDGANEPRFLHLRTKSYPFCLLSGTRLEKST